MTRKGHSLRSKGDAARDERDWAGAEAAYREHLNGQPKDVDIWVQFGHALKEQGKYVEAERAYRHAVNLRPNDADSSLHLAHLLKRVGRIAEAAKMFAVTLTASPRADVLSELSALRGAGSVVESEDEPFPQVDDWGPVVRLLFRACLGRDAEVSEQHALTASLTARTISPQRLIRELQESSEGAAHALTVMNGRLISILYEAILQRKPTPGDLADWRSALEKGRPLAALVEELESSVEAQRQQLKRIVASRGVAEVLLAEVEHTEASHDA